MPPASPQDFRGRHTGGRGPGASPRPWGHGTARLERPAHLGRQHIRVHRVGQHVVGPGIEPLLHQAGILRRGQNEDGQARRVRGLPERAGQGGPRSVRQVRGHHQRLSPLAQQLPDARDRVREQHPHAVGQEAGVEGGGALRIRLGEHHRARPGIPEHQLRDLRRQGLHHRAGQPAFLPQPHERARRHVRGGRRGAHRLQQCQRRRERLGRPGRLGGLPRALGTDLDEGRHLAGLPSKHRAHRLARGPRQELLALQARRAGHGIRHGSALLGLRRARAQAERHLPRQPGQHRPLSPRASQRGQRRLQHPRVQPRQPSRGPPFSPLPLRRGRGHTARGVRGQRLVRLLQGCPRNRRGEGRRRLRHTCLHHAGPVHSRRGIFPEIEAVDGPPDGPIAGEHPAHGIAREELKLTEAIQVLRLTHGAHQFLAVERQGDRLEARGMLQRQQGQQGRGNGQMAKLVLGDEGYAQLLADGGHHILVRDEALGHQPLAQLSAVPPLPLQHGVELRLRELPGGDQQIPELTAHRGARARGGQLQHRCGQRRGHAASGLGPWKRQGHRRELAAGLRAPRGGQAHRLRARLGPDGHGPRPGQQAHPGRAGNAPHRRRGGAVRLQPLHRAPRPGPDGLHDAPRPLGAEPDLLAPELRGRPRLQGRAPSRQAAREEPGHVLRPHTQPVLEEEVLQRIRHVPGALEAGRGLLRQRPGDDAPQRRGHPGERIHRLDIEGRDAAQHPEVVRSREELLAREQLVEQQPQQEEIRALVHRDAAHLLRGQVAHLALDHPRLGAALDIGRLGDAEVRELHFARDGDHHVGRVDVAVDDVEGPPHRIQLVMGIGEPFGHLLDDEDPLPQAHGHGHAGRGALERAEVLSIHEFHHHVVLAAHLAEIKHLQDIGVLQRNGELGLAQEQLHELAILRQGRQHALDGHGLLEPLCAEDLRQEDLRHAPRSQPSDQSINAHGASPRPDVESVDVHARAPGSVPRGRA
ncbi:NTR [Stigmatella aurantiaca DW4/3-1]|uniref:NTR n=1 Tax=Stigmatella aurantiaca (strain DW4/3-1) TaxID=378806 RepID=Q09DM9_STIAD|nr:NTR [Stigmatella aurantiaca DW4/3-1]